VVVVASMVCASSQAQVRKQNAKRAFGALTPMKIFETADQACQAAGASLLGTAGNWSRTEQVWCGGTIYATQFQSMQTTYNGAIGNSSGQVVCRFNTQQTLQYSGPPQCGDPVSTSTSGVSEYPNMVQALHVCPAGWNWEGDDICSQNAPRVARPETPCKSQPSSTETRANPVAIASGCKLETIALVDLPTAPGVLRIELAYANKYFQGGGGSVGDPSWFLDPIDRRIDFSGLMLATPRLMITRAHGHSEIYEQIAPNQWKSFDLFVTLEPVAGGGWRRRDFRNASVETFDAQGRLLSIRFFQGGGVDLVYAGPLPGKASRIVVPASGRYVDIQYSADRALAIVPPGGSPITLSYEVPTGGESVMAGAYLKSVTYEDGSVKTLTYSAAAVGNLGVSGYAKSDLLQVMGVAFDGNTAPGDNIYDPRFTMTGRSAYELSGIVNEAGQAYSNYLYDNTGRVTESNHGAGIYRFQFAYTWGDTGGRTTITEPLGGAMEYVFSTIADQIALQEIVQTGQGFYSSHALQYDTARRLTAELWPGTTGLICQSHDTITQRVALRLEGRARNAGCPSDLATYNPPSGPGLVERKLTMQWDPTWRLLTRHAQPNRVTVFAYNGQVTDGSLVSCAPASATLHGVALPLLCWSEERATADDTGGLGVGAATVGVPRRVSFTYNERGQLLTHNGARIDLTDATTLTYHTTSTATTAVGDLHTMTNPQGHVHTVTKYNARGQPTEMIDSNGVVTALQYGPRGWLTNVTASVNSVSRTTLITYRPFGAIERVTQPDGSYIHLAYDGAQRLVSAQDNLGNRIEYTRDSAGNATQEQVKGPSGALATRVARVFSDLNRLQSLTGVQP
jgi:YD repeat-containing protein